MKQDTIEDHALRMARAVDSRHIGRADSKSELGIPPENKKGRSALPGASALCVRIKSAGS